MTTFDRQAGIGVSFFIKILAGSFAGIYVAELVKAEPSDDSTAGS